PFAWSWPERLWMKRLVGTALSRFDALLVRDEFSKPAVERLTPCAEVVASTDIAVFLQAGADPRFAHVLERIERSGSRPRVVVCTRDFQPRYGIEEPQRQSHLRRLAQLLDRVQADLADV